ncbi:nuclear transcription factor Y subunit B-9-like [Neltuma alba]|uniref:nuclear transcription factor Y subunit B-9-like n=1 Tax=Neltuma alba TaxID=207710 RepID=UPI0010A2CE00|nr:nuclear transcription factor Y subunit B-9-like [Prosopis alba]
MEGSGSPFFPPAGHHHHHQQPASSGGLNLSGAANPAGHGGAPVNSDQDQQQQQPAQRSVMREQDQYMPIANVIRIMRRVLPSHAKISDEAKETVQECVSEYISFITSEANQRCRQEQRKTVTADDVLWAMEKLGFDDYVGPLHSTSIVTVMVAVVPVVPVATMSHGDSKCRLRSSHQ